MAVIRNLKLRKEFELSIGKTEHLAGECMFVSMLLSEEEHKILAERFDKEVTDYNVLPWYKFVLDNVNVTLKE